MRIVVAPDKFKGTIGARDFSDSIADALRAAGHDATSVPMSDGGEGFLDAMGGANRVSTVTGPLGEPVEAPWRLHRGRAIIEMAAASGLTLAGGAEENDPIEATTLGTGELIAQAVELGARHVLVGVGGSATTDGGMGALRALSPPQRYKGVELQVACDVRTHFVDAARVFAPQKGATPTQVALLERRLERLAQVFLDERGVDVTALDGSGAAGGLAGGLASIGAELVTGFDLVVAETGLDELVEGADLVITGEGFLDDESFDGKVVGGVAELCAELGVRCIAIVGEVVEPLPQLPDGFEVVSLTQRFGEQRSMDDPAACAIEVALGLV